MRAPDFWRHDGVIARLLAPLAGVFRLAAGLRRRATKPYRAAVPVLCVGNLVAGGAGKTPTALCLQAMLDKQGIAAHFLTRGYGGKLRGPVQVAPTQHDCRLVGDEALLLARQAPTWVARDRVAGAQAAIAAGAEMIIMDDGLQNPQLAKDLSILVVDAGYGFGNGRLLPAGPLRQPIDAALESVDMVVVIAAPTAVQTRLPALQQFSRPLFHAALRPPLDGFALDWLQPRAKVFAFAGIGRPEKFFQTLTALGLELVGSRTFGDHHVYTEEDVMVLIEAAVAADARAVTTEKDAVRLPAAAQAMVSVLPVQLTFDAPEAVLRALRRQLGLHQEPSGHG